MNFRRKADRIIDRAHNAISNAKIMVAYSFTDTTREKVLAELAEAQAFLRRAKEETMATYERDNIYRKVALFAAEWEKANGYKPAPFQKTMAMMRLERGQSVEQIIADLSAQVIK